MNESTSLRSTVLSCSRGGALQGPPIPGCPGDHHGRRLMTVNERQRLNLHKWHNNRRQRKQYKSNPVGHTTKTKVFACLCPLLKTSSLPPIRHRWHQHPCSSSSLFHPQTTVHTGSSSSSQALLHSFQHHSLRQITFLCILFPSLYLYLKT